MSPMSKAKRSRIGSDLICRAALDLRVSGIELTVLGLTPRQAQTLRFGLVGQIVPC